MKGILLSKIKRYNRELDTIDTQGKTVYQNVRIDSPEI